MLFRSRGRPTRTRHLHCLPLLLFTLLATPAAADRQGGRDHHPAPPPSAPTLVVRWNETLLACIRLQKLGPPMTARAIAMAYTAGFDAWACHDEVAVSTRAVPDFRRPAAERVAAPREQAFSVAVYRALFDLFPAGRDLARAQMVSLGFDPDDAGTDLAVAQGDVGNFCAANLLAYR